MKMNTEINEVSDTALWVAYYRQVESERPDALFQDPFAKKLVGERGRKIAESTRSISQYTQWQVVIRTCIIDQYISMMIAEGVDTVINLGAGLDTRPYRLDLPPNLRWIEVDYPHLIEKKSEVLAQDRPRCVLERVSLDLADDRKRIEFFSAIGASSKKALILTEGVIPYLSPEHVTRLAHDLFSQPSFAFWIVEYLSPQVYPHLKNPKRMAALKNAPFLYFPENWFEAFHSQGWKTREMRYIPEESMRLKRRFPGPWWIGLMTLFISKERKQGFMKMSGYALLAR